MSSQTLDNLVKTGQLKREPPAKSEVEGLLRAARAKLKDAQLDALSLESRFELAYSAAHSLALAALRQQGFRSENRFLVFQCLVHTMNLAPAKVRVLSDAHNKRNLAAYEGEVDVSESLVSALVRVAKELSDLQEKIG